MLPRPTCPYCIEGAALQAAGLLPVGVPFCLEHEVPDVGLDDGGTSVSGRASVFARIFVRWQVRATERVFGWTLPIVALLLGLGSVLVLAVRWPRTSLFLAAVGGVWWALRVHPGPALLVLAAALQIFAAVALVAPSWCRLWVLARWRTLVVYRRLWRTAMHAAELERRDEDGQVRRPAFRRVRCLPTVDVVHVRGLLGQRFGEWEEAAGMVGHVFGAHGVRVHRGDDRRLTLELARGPRGRSWNRDGALHLEEAR